MDGGSHLLGRLGRYFNAPTFSDITIIAPDNRTLRCHQVVLCAGSARFAGMLESGSLAPGEELPVWGVDSDALESIVQFFYSGECLLTLDNGVAIMDAAVRLDVPVLAAAAERYVRTAAAAHASAALTVLGSALRFKIADLVIACVAAINTRCVQEKRIRGAILSSKRTCMHAHLHVAALWRARAIASDLLLMCARSHNK